MWRCLSAAYPAKAVPPFSSSNNQLHSCRLSNAEKYGANNQQKQSKAPLTVQYEIHTINLPIQQQNWRSTSKKQSMGVCEGAFPLPILQKQCRPSALQTINCTLADYQLQKSVRQTTNRNRARLHSLFSMKFTQVPSQYSNWIGERQVRNKVWVCEGAFCCLSSKSSTTLQLFKQSTALLQTINCRKVWQTTDRNRARLPSLFGMKFTQVPSKYSNLFAEQTTLPNNSVAYDTERWRKVVLDDLWRSHIDQHWLASIWSVGSSRQLPPK
jgi:hypothetical protein